MERELVFELKSSAPLLRFNLSSLISTSESNEEAGGENGLATERSQSAAWKVYPVLITLIGSLSIMIL